MTIEDTDDEDLIALMAAQMGGLKKLLKCAKHDDFIADMVPVINRMIRKSEAEFRALGI